MNVLLFFEPAAFVSPLHESLHVVGRAGLKDLVPFPRLVIAVVSPLESAGPLNLFRRRLTHADWG